MAAEMVKFLTDNNENPDRQAPHTASPVPFGEGKLLGVGERLKRAREIAGLSQPELAKRAGATKGRIAMIEVGETKTLKAEDALNFAQILRVRPEWLVFGRGPKDPGMPAVDTSLLTRVLTRLEETLSAKKKSLPPKKKAELTGYLYERAVAEGQAPTAQEVERLVDLAV